jgi:MtN3 and saliva related transmembrane protein
VLVDLIGAVASLITGTQVARQLKDAFAVERPVGVSWLTWELATIQSGGLLFFSISKGYTMAIVINAWVGIVSLLIIARLIAPGGVLAALRFVALAGVTGIGLAGAFALSGVRLVGTIGAVASAFVWIPQAWRSVRTRSPTGLSWTLVVLGVASSILWIAYALMLSQWRLLVPPISAIASLVVTAIYALWRGRRPYPAALDGNGMSRIEEKEA